MNTQTQHSKSARSSQWQPVVNMSLHSLKRQNQDYRGRGGISQENCSLGFLPAFADTTSGAVYMSRFANGRLAPMHLLDGLPEQVVVARCKKGKVTEVKPCIIAGFVRDGHFYTREQAAKIATKH